MKSHCTGRHRPPTFDRDLLTAVLDVAVSVLVDDDATTDPSPTGGSPTAGPPTDGSPVGEAGMAAMATGAPLGGGAVAFGVASVGTEIEFALHDLAGADPVRALFGFEAPPEWAAFGVVACGRARRSDPGHRGPPAARATGDDSDAPVQFGILVSRSGLHVTRIQGADRDIAPIDPKASTDRPDQSRGRVPDACRRVLGLPTAPPVTDSGELWALLWLEAILADALVAPRRRTWTEVVAVHPAFAAVIAGAPGLIDGLHGDVVELGQATRRAWSWDRMLEAVRAGRLDLGFDSVEANWMDEGMFSREVLGLLPAVEDLFADLECLLAPDVAVRIDQALRSWGLR